MMKKIACWSGSMRKEVVLIRHGETEWNAQLRWQGHTDIPLNSNGVQQAESLAEELRSFALDVLFSSDLVRAYQTSKIISARLDLPIFTSDGLREVDVGAAEGLGYDETVKRFGEESISRWRSSLPVDLSFAFPDGETKLEALERVQRAIGDFLQNTGAVRVAIVSHGMLIRTFLQHIFPELDMPSVLSNCGYVPLSYELPESGWSLRDDVSLSSTEPLPGRRSQ